MIIAAAAPAAADTPIACAQRKSVGRTPHQISDRVIEQFHAMLRWEYTLMKLKR